VVLSGRLLGQADPQRGRFRPYLKQAIRNFLVDEHRRDARTVNPGVRPNAQEGGWEAIVDPTATAIGDRDSELARPGTLLLEFALGERRSYVWVVTPEGVSAFELPKQDEIDAAARRMYERLTGRKRQGTVKAVATTPGRRNGPKPSTRKPRLD
jgi:hypothetical protein